MEFGCPNSIFMLQFLSSGETGANPVRARRREALELTRNLT